MSSNEALLVVAECLSEVCCFLIMLDMSLYKDHSVLLQSLLVSRATEEPDRVALIPWAPEFFIPELQSSCEVCSREWPICFTNLTGPPPNA